MQAQRTIVRFDARPAVAIPEPKAPEKESRFSNDGHIVLTSFELNRNSGAALRQACEGTVVITRHRKAVAYLVSPHEWQQIGRRLKELERRLGCVDMPNVTAV